MTNFPVGQTVRLTINGKKAFGEVRTEATLTASGPVVKVKLLPDFAHLLPTGWTDAGTEDLTAVRLCECAKLAYRPIYGDHQGELFTTGCDFSRMPGRNSKFLPGHDAKAKGFLIRASQAAQQLENGKGALEQAREFGDKISMAVAKGMDNARRGRVAKVRSTRSSAPEPGAPTREDLLTDAQRLQKEHKVTDAMLTLLARGVTNDLKGWEGHVSGPTGSIVAMQTRGLLSRGHVTDLGYAVMGHPTLAETTPDAIRCKDDHGSYSRHIHKNVGYHWECVRCGTELGDPTS